MPAGRSRPAGDHSSTRGPGGRHDPENGGRALGSGRDGPRVGDLRARRCSRGRVALVTGGGTNLGREAAARARWPAARSVVIAGRREDVLEEAVADIGERGDRRRRRHPRACRRGRGSSRAPLERHGRLDVLVNNAGGQYFVPAEDDRAEGLARRAPPERRRHRDDDARGARARASARPARAGRSSTSRSRRTTGMPAMAHTGAARAAVEALHARARRRVGAARHRRGRARRSAASTPSRCASTPRSSGAARPAASRCSAWGRCRSSPGSSRCSPRRSAARSAARWSRSTAAPTTGSARGRRRPSPTTTATCPPRTRRPAPCLRYPAGTDGLAGEVLWLHRSLPSF